MRDILALMKLWVTILGEHWGDHFRGLFGGDVSSPFILIYFRLATNKFTIIFYDGIVSEGFTWECSFCLIITYAKVRVLNKTLSKIN